MMIQQKSKIDLNENSNCLNKKTLKRISPLYYKMMNCDICEKEVGEKLAKHYEHFKEKFCGTCIIKAKDSGYWTKCPKTGHKILIPIIKKSNNISNINKSIMDGFVKFQLIQYSKSPSNEWKTSNKEKYWNKEKKIENNCGVGIPCGKINNIVVIDLDDYKWDENHSFIKTFGRDYTKFGTYTQKSGKGGIHLFFEYDKDLFNKCCSNGIDILSDIDSTGKYAKKYVVGAGTTIRYSNKDKEKYNLTEDYGTYEILCDKPVIKITDELKDWLINNCYTEQDREKTTKFKAQKQIQVSNEVGYYKYNLTNGKIREICEKLYRIEPKYFTEYRVKENWGWLIFTTAMKSIGAFEIWDEYSKKYGGEKYDKTENIKIWNGLKAFNEYNCFNHILLKIEERTLLDYVKYKPCHTPKITFDKVGEYDKLGKHMILNIEKDYAIMSGTGTGKTTIVKKDILPKTNFISIVSRRTLAYEQYKIFQEDDIDCLWYEHFEKEFIPHNNNVVIQLDSLMKLSHYKEYIGDYTIFLDEYSSLVEHLIRSPTLSSKRALIFKIFTRLIKDAKQVICVDADLNKYTLKLMDFCGRDLIKINNTYNHNQDVPCKEYFDINDMVEEMKKKDKFLCCLDSARLGKALVEEHFNSIPLEHVTEEKVVINGKEMNKYEMNIYQDEKGFIVFISAENDFMPNLDEWDRVIFSPKIVYGLDSTMKRDVFGIFKEHTISPRSMLQQIARCRDINQLHYIFFKKKFNEPKFIDIKDVEEINKRYDEMSAWEEICDEESCELFMKTLSIMEYNEDCQNTNKFCHFKILLDERGFKHIKSNVSQTKSSEINKLEKKQKNKDIDSFDKKHPKYSKINEILQIPEDKWEDYCDLFVNQSSLQKFLNIRSYMTKSGNDIDSRLQEKEEFNVLKVKSNEFKILLLEQFMKSIGCENKIDIIPKKTLSESEATAWMEKLELSFRFRMEQKPDLKKKEDCQMMIEKIMKKLFGGNNKMRYYSTEAQIESGNDKMKFTKTNLFNTERKQINKKRITINTLNKDFFKYVYDVMSYSSNRIVDWDNYKFGFNDNKSTNRKVEDCLFLDDDEENPLDNGVNV